MDGITFWVLSQVESASLFQPFSLDEDDRVVADCEGNKRPGLDMVLILLSSRLFGTCYAWI